MTEAEELELLELEAKAAASDDRSGAPEGPGYVESLGRGAAQGATLGFADEIAGAGGAAIDAAKKMSFTDVVKDYIANRNSYRASDSRAKAANPKVFGAGEIGAGIATAFVPGLNVGKAATLGGRALGAAGLGAVTGLGTSEAEDMHGVSRDVLMGGATGAVAAPVIEKIVAPAVGATIRGAGNAAGWAGKKALNVGLDVPEGVVERYMTKPDAIRNAGTKKEIAQKLADTLGEVIEDTKPLSEAAEVTLSNVRQPLPHLDYNEAISRLKASADADAQALAKQLEEEYIRRMGGIAPEAHSGYLTEREMHNVKRTLQEAADWSPVLPKKEQARARMASGELNAGLKENNPGYDQAMENLARNLQVKKDLAKKFGIQRDTYGVGESGFTHGDSTITKIAGFLRENREEGRQVLKELREQGYGNLAEDIENTLAKDALTGGNTNGSRKVNMMGGAGAVLGGGFGTAVAGPVGWGVGTALGYGAGAIAGGAMDKYGKAVGKKAMDATLAMQRLSRNPNTQKFVGAIQNAASRGQGSVATTLFLLQQTEPLVNEALNNPED